MRKFTMDNRKIPCPTAVFSGHADKLVAHRGDGITFLAWSDGPVNLGRVLGRIKTCDSDGEDCVGWAVVMALAPDGYGIYLRWIKPEWIKSVFTMPTKVPAFFFGDMMKISNEELLHLYEQGSLHEMFIDKTTTEQAA